MTEDIDEICAKENARAQREVQERNQKISDEQRHHRNYQRAVHMLDELNERIIEISLDKSYKGIEYFDSRKKKRRLKLPGVTDVKAYALNNLQQQAETFRKEIREYEEGKGI